MAHTLSPSMKELVESINSQVNTITKFLDSHSLPHPSFRPDAPSALPEEGQVQAARLALIEAASDLILLAQGPGEYIRNEAFIKKHDVSVLSILNHYDIWNAVPIEDKISYDDLSKKIGIPYNCIHRVLRHAMTRRTFCEPARGYIAHTANSAAVVKDSSLSAWIGHNIDEIGRALSWQVKALDMWGDTEDPSKAALCLATELPEGGAFFEFLQNDSEGGEKGWRAKRFGLAMTAMSKTGAFSSTHMHTGFDWASLGEATLIDIGGSAGHDDIELALHYPSIKFIIQDRAEVVTSFEASLPSDLNSRISFQTHDFMTLQPIKGADVYFLKHILHDWPDLVSVKILQNIVPAMTTFEDNKGSRLLIMDSVMPEMGEVPLTVMQLNTAMDLQMMAALSAKERTRTDWEALLRAADQRLRIVNVRQPTGSADAVIEVVLDPHL